MYRVLVVDDERKIRETICEYLTAKGFDAQAASDGEEAVSKVADETFDLVIMDVMMPVMDGIRACQEIREFSDTPVLFLSALGEESDMLGAFNAGADDYIVKPFPLSVLEQKCRMMIKRSKGLSQDETLEAAGIILDYASRTVKVRRSADTTSGENSSSADATQTLNISGKDFALLAYLMENKNIVLGREQILAKVWGYGFDGEDRVVDTHIKNLRKALGDKGQVIETVIGSGYILREDNHQ